MNSKIFGLFAFSVLAVVFLMSFASAAVSFVPTSINQDVLHAEGSVVINFQLNETSGIGGPFVLSTWITSSTKGTLTLPSQPTTINKSQTISLSATLSEIPADFIGTITGSITVDDGSNNILPITVNVIVPDQKILDCSSVGNIGELKVKDIEFTNTGIGDKEFGDDNEWFPLDDIEVDIEIENNGNDDIDDVEIHWGIYNTQSNEWVIELEDEKDFNLKDGDEDVVTVSFNLEDDIDVSLEDLTNGEDYRFYVIARGDVDNSANDVSCISGFETTEVIIESDFVVLDNIEFPETVMCGDTVQIKADVWNIGDNDQDDVSVDVVSKGLNVDKTTLIGNIDAFDNDEFSFTFNVPMDAEEKFHSIVFQVWDEDNDVYENDFDEEESEFAIALKVEGCLPSLPEVTVFATLDSEAKAGNDLLVSAVVTNNGNELQTFTINAAGYSQWADSWSADTNSIVLNAGESRNVMFTFDVSKDAEGSNAFTIELVSSENEVIAQPVSVNIEPRSGFGFTGNVISGDNLPWVIGALNILLVVIIIIVAVRVAKR